MRLNYDISVTGEQRVKSALGGIERKFQEHNRRLQRDVAKLRQAGVGGQEELRTQRLQRGMQNFLHRQRLQQIKTEERARIQAERNAGRAAAQEQRKLEQRRLAALRRAERQALTDRANRERFTRNATGFVGRSVSGTVGMLGGTATMALGLGGGMLVANSVRKFGAAEKASAVLANKAIGGTPGTREQLQASVMNQARAEGIRSGFGAEGAINALRQFHNISGLLKEGQALLPFMTDLADAYGADLGDVGRTGGQIAQALKARGITGDESVRQTTNILTDMAAQAKVGSIEFAELATEMGKLISSTARFDGEIDQLTSTMGAISQLAIAGAASSPEEAMTAILRISDDIITNWKHFDKAGVDVFADEGKTKLRAPEQIIRDMLVATGGDLTKIKKMFKIRSTKAIQPFQTLYTEAGGGEAGLKALDNLIKVASGTASPEEIRESAAFVRSMSAKQFDIAMAKLEDALGSKFLPVLVRLIPKFEQLIPSIEMAANVFTRFIDSFAKDPGGTIFKLIAAKLVADIAVAGVGKHVTAAIVNSINKMFSGRGVPPAMGGTVGGTATGATPIAAGKAPVNLAGALSLGGTLGLTIGSAILTTGVLNFEAGEVSIDTGGRALKESRHSTQTGDVEAARQALMTIRDEKERASKTGWVGSLAAGLMEMGPGFWLLDKLGAIDLDDPNLGKDIEAGIGLRDPAAEKSLDKFETEALKNLGLAQQKAAELAKLAAEEQKAAAEKMDKAAEKMGAAGNRPNRGDSPSPVKG